MRRGRLAVLLIVVIGLAGAGLLMRQTLRLHRAPAASAAIPGVTLDSMMADARPAIVVTSLKSNGAAGAAGLQVGDRIEGVDGRPAPSVAAVRREVAHAKGRPIDIRVWRAGRVEEIRVPGNGKDGR